MSDPAMNEEIPAKACPITEAKDYASPSVFKPEALLRESRRQRGLPLADVPPICILDPDGDLVRHLKRTGAGRLHEGWACYHTELLSARPSETESSCLPHSVSGQIQPRPSPAAASRTIAAA